MALDPNIILQAGRDVTPLLSAADIQQQQAEREFQQIKLQQARQGVADDQALRAAYAAGGDVGQALQSKGLYKPAMEYQKFQTEQQKAQSERGKAVAEGMKQGAGMILANPTEENAIRTLTETAQLYGMPQQMVDGAKARIYAARNDPNQLRQLAQGWGADAEKVLGKFTTENLGGTMQTQRVNPLTGQVEVASVQQRTQSPDSIAGQAVQMRGQNMTDARAREFNATKEEENRLKREQKQDVADMTKASQVASFDTMLGTLDRLKAHPGLEWSVGLKGKLPTLPGGESANFQAELETFKSQAFIPMVSQLKGMGALSDAEGKKLTAAVGALDPNMGEKAFRESMDRIIADMEQAKARVVGKPKPTNEAPQGKKPPSKTINVGGQEMRAELAPDGQYYVQQNGRWSRVKE